MAIKILTLDGLQDSRLCGLLSQLLENHWAIHHTST